MMNHGYTYQSTFTVSDVVHWRIEDIIGGDKRLDFSKAFMPESFAPRRTALVSKPGREKGFESD